MLAPLEVPRYAKGRAKGRSKKRAASDRIKAGAPAFGCTVHPLRLQAPRAAYAHKSPGQQQSIKAGALRTLYGALARFTSAPPRAVLLAPPPHATGARPRRLYRQHRGGAER